MKFAIQSPCHNGAIDGTVQANLLKHLPNQVPVSNADVVIVPLSWFDDFQINPALYQIKKPVVILDFLELGLDWDVNSGRDGHILGRNSADFPRTDTTQWRALDAWVRDTGYVTYFKRELLNREVTQKIVAVDFPCYLPIPGIQTKEEFDARPLEVFHFWGLSHPSRPQLHGDIFREAYHTGYEVISQFGHWDGYFSSPRGRTWASIHAPHFDRKPMVDVMHFNHRSKISASLPGAGVKCFRDSESGIGSIPAFWNCGIARSYPWEAEKNCILLTPGNEWLDLHDAVKQDNLYDLYVAAQETIQKYSAPTYARDYILPHIERNL